MNKLVLILIAIFLPPVAVFLQRGFGKDLLINILLCLLVFFPGMVHALWVVSNLEKGDSTSWLSSSVVRFCTGVFFVPPSLVTRSGTWALLHAAAVYSASSASLRRHGDRITPWLR